MNVVESTVAVIGLGLVGSSTLHRVHQMGSPCIGYDLNETVVEAFENGKMPPGNVNPVLKKALPFEGVTYGTTASVIENADIYIICVPTDVNEYGLFDLTHIMSALDDISQYFQDGNIIFVMSTIDSMALQKIRERYENIISSDEVHIAVLPEFYNPGTEEEFPIDEVSRPFGALSDYANERGYEWALEFTGGNAQRFASAYSVVNAKVETNSQRASLITDAMLDAIREEIQPGGNVWEVRKAASQKPIGGYQEFRPSFGLAGHCVGVDNNTEASRAREIGLPDWYQEVAGVIDRYMPLHAALTIFNMLDQKLSDHNWNGQIRKVTLLGTAYKPNTAETRRSPAIRIMKRLSEIAAETGKNLDITTYDPYVVPEEIPTSASLEESLKRSELAVIVTPHDDFKEVPLQTFADHGVLMVYDGANIYSRSESTDPQVEIVTFGVHHPYTPGCGVLNGMMSQRFNALQTHLDVNPPFKSRLFGLKKLSELVGTDQGLIRDAR